MGKRYNGIDEHLEAFILRQRLFFVGTAAADGRVNVSPKGLDTLRILGPNRVMWLNLTGSGNETAAHLLDNDRMTLMFCAFEGEPTILRLYGRARAIHAGEDAWSEEIERFPPIPGARQLIDMDVEFAQTSCGMGVPLFDYAGERGALERWAERKGEDGVRRYWGERNRLSIDGKPTGMPEP